MPLNIRGEQVNQLAEELAAGKRVSKTAAVKLALENALRCLRRERLRDIAAVHH